MQGRYAWLLGVEDHLLERLHRRGAAETQDPCALNCLQARFLGADPRAAHCWRATLKEHWPPEWS